MGKTIPIIDLITAMAALQWILGPFIEYSKETSHYKYYMYVDEPTYMSFIVPAVIAFVLGTRIYKSNTYLDEIGDRVKLLLEVNPKLPYLLIIGGLAISFTSSFVPAFLRFVFFLLSNVKYIGVIYLLFSDKPNRWPIFWGMMSFTAITSIAAGLFHDLLLWGMLTFTFIAREMRLSQLKKYAVVVLAVLFATTIQSVKSQYREMVWAQGYTGNKLALFLSLSSDQIFGDNSDKPKTDTDVNVRLNQGWIISAVMHNVPEREPYAGGSTIIESIKASLLPRFLAPDKKKAGGQENFEKFTGLMLGENTSMGISLVGEGYANYGIWGGILFMFCWGLFVSWFWKKLIRWGDSIYPTLLIWSPILFLQVIKAETEFAVVLNHLIKAAVLVFGLLWFIKRHWGIRI